MMLEPLIEEFRARWGHDPAPDIIALWQREADWEAQRIREEARCAEIERAISFLPPRAFWFLTKWLGSGEVVFDPDAIENEYEYYRGRNGRPIRALERYIADLRHGKNPLTG